MTTCRPVSIPKIAHANAIHHAADFDDCILERRLAKGEDLSRKGNALIILTSIRPNGTH